MTPARLDPAEDLKQRSIPGILSHAYDDRVPYAVSAEPAGTWRPTRDEVRRLTGKRRQELLAAPLAQMPPPTPDEIAAMMSDAPRPTPLAAGYPDGVRGQWCTRGRGRNGGKTGDAQHDRLHAYLDGEAALPELQGGRPWPLPPCMQPAFRLVESIAIRLIDRLPPFEATPQTLLKRAGVIMRAQLTIAFWCRAEGPECLRGAMHGGLPIFVAAAVWWPQQLHVLARAAVRYVHALLISLISDNEHHSDINHLAEAEVKTLDTYATINCSRNSDRTSNRSGAPADFVCP